MNEVTILIEKARQGDTVSLNELYDRVFSELRSIAAQKMAAERPGHTLQATALVSEAYIRLGGSDGFHFKNRAHFFGAAAEAMRRILIDSIRSKRRQKRGGDQDDVELFESQIAAPAKDDQLLQVHEALDTLAAEDPMKANISKLRFFVGLNHQEIADALGTSEVTVRRHWRAAKMRLFELITEQ